MKRGRCLPYAVGQRQKAHVSGPIIASEGSKIRIWETSNTVCQFPIAQSDAIALMEFCHNTGMDYTLSIRPMTPIFRKTPIGFSASAGIMTGLSLRDCCRYSVTSMRPTPLSSSPPSKS